MLSVYILSINKTESKSVIFFLNFSMSKVPNDLIPLLLLILLLGLVLDSITRQIKLDDAHANLLDDAADDAHVFEALAFARLESQGGSAAAAAAKAKSLIGLGRQATYRYIVQSFTIHPVIGG